MLVGWAFIWPHLAWQLAYRSADPRSSEILNLKADAMVAGVWMGLMGVDLLPTVALVMMIGMNLMGAGGVRLFGAGAMIAVITTLITLQLTGTTCLYADSARIMAFITCPGALSTDFCVGELSDSHPTGGAQASPGVNEYPRRNDRRVQPSALGNFASQ